MFFKKRNPVSLTALFSGIIQATFRKQMEYVINECFKWDRYRELPDDFRDRQLIYDAPYVSVVVLYTITDLIAQKRLRTRFLDLTEREIERAWKNALMISPLINENSQRLSNCLQATENYSEAMHLDILKQEKTGFGPPVRKYSSAHVFYASCMTKDSGDQF